MSDTPIRIATRELDLRIDESTTNFTVHYTPAIRLGSRLFNVSLHKLHTWNSFKNFRAQFNNTTFVVNNGVSNATVVLPDGIYNGEEFKETFASLLEAAQPGSEDDVVWQFNSITGKVLLVLSAGFSITMTLASEEQMGFKPWSKTPDKSGTTAYAGAQTVISAYTPSWTFGVESIDLTCDLVANSYSNGTSAGILASFTPLNGPFSSIEYEPRNTLEMQVNKETIDSIAFKITDQSGKVLPNEDHMTYTIKISPIRPFWQPQQKN